MAAQGSAGTVTAPPGGGEGPGEGLLVEQGSGHGAADGRGVAPGASGADDVALVRRLDGEEAARVVLSTTQVAQALDTLAGDGRREVGARALRKALRRRARAAAAEHGLPAGLDLRVELTGTAAEEFGFTFDDVARAASAARRERRRERRRHEELVCRVTAAVAERLAEDRAAAGRGPTTVAQPGWLLSMPGLPAPHELAVPLGPMPTSTKALTRWLAAYQAALDIRRTAAALVESEGEMHRSRLATELAELELQVARQTVREMAAESSRSLVYTFYDDVEAETVAAAMDEVGQISRTNPGAPIRVVLSSPGGSVIDGLALFDFLRELSSRGHEITTVALGQAASMGAVLLQAGDRRLMGRNAHLLIHEVQVSGFAGPTAHLSDELRFVERLQDRLLAILTGRSALTVKRVRREWKRRDWWIDAQEALELGLVDELV